MKSLFLSILALSLSTAAMAAVPSEKAFDEVNAQARKLGYFGYDTVICQSKTGAMVLGGVDFWNAPLQVYLVDQKGQVTPTKRVSADNVREGAQKFSANGEDVMLDMGAITGSAGEGFSRVLKYDNAILSVGPTEMAQLVTCYRLSSGLELN